MKSISIVTGVLPLMELEFFPRWVNFTIRGEFWKRSRKNWTLKTSWLPSWWKKTSAQQKKMGSS